MSLDCGCVPDLVEFVCQACGRCTQHCICPATGRHQKKVDGAAAITAERERQLTEEGYTLGHDLENNKAGELALAACYYAHPDAGEAGKCFPRNWDYRHGKRGAFSMLRRLAVAGALIAAEYDRIVHYYGEQADAPPPPQGEVL